MAKDVMMIIEGECEGREVTAKEAFGYLDDHKNSAKKIRYICLGSHCGKNCDAEMVLVKRVCKGKTEYYFREKNKERGHIEGCDNARRAKKMRIIVPNHSIESLNLFELFTKFSQPLKEKSTSDKSSENNLLKDEKTTNENQVKDDNFLDMENIFVTPRNVIEIWSVIENADPQALLNDGDEVWRHVLSTQSINYYAPGSGNYLNGLTIFQVKKVTPLGISIANITEAVTEGNDEYYLFESTLNGDVRANRIYFLLHFDQSIKKALYRKVFDAVLKKGRTAIILGQCFRVIINLENVCGEFYSVRINSPKQMDLLPNI